MKPLSSRQKTIFNLIKSFISTNGYSPSLREIAAEFGIASPSTVHAHLEKLREHGLINWKKGELRTLTVIDQQKVISFQPNGNPVALEDLEPGSLFLYGETIGMKTEYRLLNGAVKAYIIGSGEMFWGGKSTGRDQRLLKVQPLRMEEFNA